MSEPRPCGDPLGVCVYAGPHDGPHKVPPGSAPARVYARSACEPTTEAGRTLLRYVTYDGDLTPAERKPYIANVARIEQEAVRAYAERLVEPVARAIYDAMRENDSEGRDYPWVPGGNSNKQEEARRRAREALIEGSKPMNRAALSQPRLATAYAEASDEH